MSRDDIVTVTLWSSGELACVFLTRKDPPYCAVQILRQDRAIVTEPCKDADDGARLGEYFWAVFVDSAI